MTAKFEPVLQANTALGESPVWSREAQRLYFVDIDGQRLHVFDPADGDHSSVPVDEPIGCVAPARDGGFIAGLRSGVWRLDADGRRTRKLADNPEDQASSRFNDGKVDPAGRLLAGTLDQDKQGRAGLYRYDRRGLARLTDGLQTSNGLAFSPDGRTLYHSDTPRFRIDRYDYDVASGEVANRRTFVQLDPAGADRARPDGAAVDADGCYWSALYDGGRVHRYDPDGRLMAAYAAPARQPTMPAFGGPDLRTLYLTCARGAADRGALFAMPVDTPGLAIAPFDPAA